MKKLLIILFFTILSCTSMEVSKEKNYHSHRGYVHAHANVKYIDEQNIIAEIQIMSQNKKVLKLVKEKENIYKNESAILEILDNKDIVIKYEDKNIVFYEWKQKKKSGFGNKAYKNEHEGHSH